MSSGELLPSGWVDTKLEEVLLSIVGGGTPSKSNESYYQGHMPWMSVKDMNKNVLKDTQDHISQEAVDNSSTNIIPAGIPIIATRMSLGKIVVADFDSTINQDLKALFHAEGVNRDFLIGWYRSISKMIESLGTGTTVKGIRLEVLKALSFPLPPLAEQKVIADKLDTLLAQVETTKARLERIPKILKTFRQSVLAAAVSGRLTEEWRELNTNENATLLKECWLHEREKCFNEKQEEDIRSGKIKRPKKFKSPVRPDLETGPIDKYPETWVLVSVSEFAECLDAERIPVKKDQRLAAEGLYPYFGANGEVDKVDEFIFDDELVLVTEDETFYGRVKPIAYRFSGKCWVNNHAHVLRAPTKIANDYLCFSLMYYKVIPWLSGTTGRAKLTQAALNSLPIGMPPENEQTEIVRRVEELLVLADNIEQKTNAALERVNNLTQSILAKAFRGELTAEWRAANRDLNSGENSADALLAKIKAEREALKKQPKKKTVARKTP